MAQPHGRLERDGTDHDSHSPLFGSRESDRERGECGRSVPLDNHEPMFRLTDDLEDADWIHVTDEDQIQWLGRPSRYTIAVSLVVAAVLAAGGVALSYGALPIVERRGLPLWVGLIPLSLTLVGISSGLRTYLSWVRHLYVITDEEIYVRDGLLSREITQVPLERVQNASFDQSLLERLLSFGNVHIFTAGSSTEDLTFESVPNPQDVAETLTNTQSEQRDQRPGSHGAV